MGNCCQQVNTTQSSMNQVVSPQQNGNRYINIESSRMNRNSSIISNNSLSRISSRRASQIQEQIQLQSQQGQNVDIQSLFQIYVQLRQGERQIISSNNLILLLALLRALENIPESQGLTKQQIKSLAKTKAIDSQSTCPVCQDSINKDQQVIVLNCNHPFHVECISEWLQKSNKCPLCRKQTVVQRQQ